MKIVQVITDYLRSTILTTKGDIIKHDGVSAKKFPLGGTRRLLRVNAAGDDLEYVAVQAINHYLTGDGDLIRHLAGQSSRFARGAAGQIIRVNNAGDDIEYQNPGDYLCEDIFHGSNPANVNLISTGITVTTIDMGNVVVDDIHNIHGLIEVENYNAQTWMIVKMEKDSGVATPKFCYDFTDLEYHAQIEPDQRHTWNLETLLRIVGSGSLVLKITGWAIDGNCRVPAGKCKYSYRRIGNISP